MKTFLLVHGAWHGGWCWGKTAEVLRDQGHTVLVPELPWLGPVHDGKRDGPLSHCAGFLAESVVGLPGELIVIGHSMGGAVISLLAERVPDRIGRLIYISAFLLEHGQCVNDTAVLMQSSLVAPNMRIDRRNQDVTIPPALLREALYADCNEADYLSASQRLQPQPLTTFLEPLQLSSTHYGRVPRAYIECTLDRAIPLSAQRQMLEQVPCDPVISLPSGHSPFISMPVELANTLIML